MSQFLNYMYLYIFFSEFVICTNISRNVYCKIMAFDRFGCDGGDFWIWLLTMAFHLIFRMKNTFSESLEGRKKKPRVEINVWTRVVYVCFFIYLFLCDVIHLTESPSEKSLADRPAEAIWFNFFSFCNPIEHTQQWYTTRYVVHDIIGHSDGPKQI